MAEPSVAVQGVPPLKWDVDKQSFINFGLSHNRILTDGISHPRPLKVKLSFSQEYWLETEYEIMVNNQKKTETFYIYFTEKNDLQSITRISVKNPVAFFMFSPSPMGIALKSAIHDFNKETFNVPQHFESSEEQIVEVEGIKVIERSTESKQANSQEVIGDDSDSNSDSDN